ncbi:MAG: ABC transporter permease [Proteobacteria bacterium]|nr:ABC transporter permease [Pseudomonadota bacterium]
MKLISRVFDSFVCGLMAVLTVVTGLFLVLPLIVVVITSFNPTTVTFPPRAWSLHSYTSIPGVAIDAFVRSLILGVCSAALAVLLCVPAAIALVKARLPGRTFIELVLRSPLQFPAIILGVAFLQYYFFWQNKLSLPLVGTFWGLLIAHTVYIFPFVLVPIIARLSAPGARLEEAAAGLGASTLTTAFRIVIPLLRPGIVAGMFTGFVMSFEDVAVTLFLVGSNMTTFPVYLLGSAEVSNTPGLYASASLGALVALTLVLVVERFIGLRTVLGKG